MSKPTQSNPASAFIIIGIANTLATVVFGLLYVLYTNDEGERYTLLLIAAVISLISGLSMFYLYGHFRKKIEKLGR
jgi:hypothetical protein